MSRSFFTVNGHGVVPNQESDSISGRVNQPRPSLQSASDNLAPSYSELDPSPHPSYSQLDLPPPSYSRLELSTPSFGLYDSPPLYSDLNPLLQSEAMEMGVLSVGQAQNRSQEASERGVGNEESLDGLKNFRACRDYSLIVCGLAFTVSIIGFSLYLIFRCYL